MNGRTNATTLPCDKCGQQHDDIGVYSLLGHGRFVALCVRCYGQVVYDALAAVVPCR